MRIWAFPSIYPYPYEGKIGSGIFAHRQYKQLIELGAELNVVVPVQWCPPYPFSQMHRAWKNAAKFNYPHKRVYEGVTVYHPRISNKIISRFDKRTPTEHYIQAIIGFFKANKIKLDPRRDVFYSQWIPDAAMVQQAAHRLGIKSAILCIGDDVVVYPQAKEDNFNIFKKAFVEADLRMANADYLMREANKVVGMNLPYSVIYYDVDTEVFKPATKEIAAAARARYNVPTDKVSIVSIGSTLIRKGWLDLFDALQEVRKTTDNFVLVAVHSGVPEFDFMAEVERRGLTANVVNIGEIKPGDLATMYHMADIFCLPSHWEGLATVVTESMASGVAVVTTDICGHPEVIKSGVNGILVPMKQPHILAGELLSLIADEDKRKMLGVNARHFMTDVNGTFHKNAAKLLKLLQGLLDK